MSPIQTDSTLSAMDELLRKLDSQFQEAFAAPMNQRSQKTNPQNTSKSPTKGKQSAKSTNSKPNSPPDSSKLWYPSLKLPKIHSLIHYTHLIKLLGTPDNFNTEVTEHQHIADCKVPYRLCNKRDPAKQMVKFISCWGVLSAKHEFLEFIDKPPEPKQYL